MKFRRLNEDDFLAKEVFKVMDRVARQSRVNLKRSSAKFGDDSEVSFVVGKIRNPASLSFCARGSGDVLNVVEGETFFNIPEQNDINTGNVKRDLEDKENYFLDVSDMMVAYKKIVDAVSEVLEENGYSISGYTVGMR